MHHATMILEGGATRGVFTSGVLDYLMEKEFYTSHVIGVSAGSCNGVDYVSRQPGMNQRLYDPQREGIQLLSGSKKIFKRQKFIKYGYDL